MTENGIDEAGLLADEFGEMMLAGSAPLDSERDGPIVELIAGSLAAGPEARGGQRTRAPASSEGRT